MNRNPYVGPRSIGGVDHPNEKIYGREREIADLMDLLIADRIVLLYSPSGAGKSSLLQAGLTPAMEKRRFHVRPVVRVNAEPPPEVHFDPANGNRYALSALLSLEELLPKEQKTSPIELAKMTLLDYLGEETKGEVLIFDQFEEVLTVDPLDYPEKLEFFTQLGDALRHRGRWAVFAMREDYLAGLDPYLNRVPTRFSNTFRLGLLEEEAALEGIYQPAAAAGVEFTSEAAKALARNLSLIRVQYEDGHKEEEIPGRYVEPVQLQVVCRRIWSKLDEGTTTIGIENIGGVSTVDDALSGYYEDTVRDVALKSGVTERTIRDWFGRSLITRQKTRSQISQKDDATVPVHPALKRLVDSYLIRSDRRLNALWYELAHDRLINPVLVNNSRNLSELQRRAELWERQGRSEGLLLTGKDRGKLKEWSQSASTALETEFLDKSRRSQQAHRTKIGLAWGVALAMLVAIVLLSQNYKNRHDLKKLAEALKTQEEKLQTSEAGLLAGRIQLSQEIEEHRKANESRRAAIEEAANSKAGESNALEKLQQALKNLQRQSDLAVASSLGTTAANKRGGRLDLVALLTIEAWNKSRSSEAMFTVFNALRNKPRATVLLNHDSQVHVMAFGPEGMLAAGCSDGTIWLWEAGWKTPPQIKAHYGAVLALAFSRDGLLVSGGADGAVRLWDPKSRQALPGPAQPHKGRVNAVAFDRGGRVLLSGAQDGFIRFWAVQDRRLVPATAQDGVPGPISAGAEIKSAGIHLANRELLAARAGGQALLWNLDSPGNSTQLAWENAEQAGISEAGSKFVVRGNEAALLWNSGNRTATPNARYHDFQKNGWGWTAALPPAANMIATAGQDRKVQVFDQGNPKAPWVELEGPESTVKLLAFNRDGNVLASLSENDRTVWVWDVHRAPPPLTQPVADTKTIGSVPLQNVAMDPKGRWFVTTTRQGARLASFTRSPSGRWEPANARELSGYFSDTWRTLDWRPKLAASPVSGRPFLVVGEPSGRISIRNPLTLVEQAVIAPAGQIAGMALNFDGTVLAVTGWRDDRSIRIYSLKDPLHPALLHTEPGPPKSPLEAIAFSPVRNLLAVGGNSMMGDKVDPQNVELRLWDLQDPAKPKLMATLAQAEAHSVVFSPDGKTLAVGGSVYSLWDVPEGLAKEPPLELVPRAVLGAPVGWPRHMRFSPDGNLLVTAESTPDSSNVGTHLYLWNPRRDVGFGDPVEFPWPVDVAAFEPDGSGLLLWSTEGIERLPLEPDTWIRDLCARANRNFSLREWKLYVGTDAYRKTCPDLPKGEGVR